MSISNITHIFFDLDNTLWDFDKSSFETLVKMYEHFKLHKLGIASPEAFINEFKAHNSRLWEQYRNGKISREMLSSVRFSQSLQAFKINPNGMGHEMSDFYLSQSARNVYLIDFAHEILTYLQTRYSLHIITNGFNEVQEEKLKNARFNGYFTGITTSEQAGINKPAVEIFKYAMEQANAKPEESVMIGDDLKIDIEGALNAHMHAILFDRNNNYKDLPAYVRISALEQLSKLF